MPRDLQENATTRSSLQVLQAIRRNPRGEHAAIEKRSKLLLDEARHLPLTILLGRQKRFQLASHDLIEERLFGVARPVGQIGNHEGIAGCKRRRNA